MNSSLKIFYNFFKFGTKISLSVLNSFFFTLALIYSFNPSIVHSQSTIVFDEPDLRNVGKNLEYLEDPGGDLKISDILSEPYRSRFQPHDSDYFKKPASNSYFWFRFRVKNLTKEDLWLRFGRSNVWLLEFYPPDTNGNYLYPEKRLGVNGDNDEYFFPSKIFCLPLNRRGDLEEKVYYLRFHAQFNINFILKIGTLLELLDYLRYFEDYVNIGFLSILLTIFFYNLFIYLSLKDITYLYYLFFLLWAMVLVPFTQNSPIFSQSFFWDYFYIWHTPVFIFMTLFSFSYLNLKKYSMKLYYLIIFLTSILALGFPVLNLLDREDFIHFNIPYQLTVILLNLSLLISGFFVWRKGFRSARFYVLAWGFLFLSIFLFFLTSNSYIGLNFFTYKVLYIGSALEGIFFSLALGDKIKQSQIEKERVVAENLELTLRHNNELEEKVKKRTDELNQLNVILSQKNEKLTSTNFQLIDQKKELELLNQTKDQIFTIVSHDLHSPISAIRTFFKILDSKSLSEEVIKTYLPRFRENIENLHFALNNILNWASSQLSGSVRRPTIFPIVEALHSSIQLLNEIGNQKNISIVNRVSEDHFIHADPDHIELVFRNLLNNAIKFSSSGQEIEIDSIENEDTYSIVFRDQGTGLKKEDLEVLLSQKGGFSLPGTGGEKGIGLGLSLCFEYLKKNEGHLKIESAPSKGSVFTVILPAADSSPN
ncbi:MAG: sensor histidine kinase [Leptospiraceae bacterium]|nr:sensor histidine kinase [Leptospiraceae bacterium]MCP5511414.1 sensor histidine kinase [Leptospiraceae bacterium]